MSRLIIVAGAGGAGKSFFLRLWEQHDSNACRIKKFVSESRAPRKIEVESGDSDLIFSRCYDPSTEEGKEWYLKNIGYIPTENKLTYHDKKYNLSDKNKKTVYTYNGTYYEVDMESIRDSFKKNKNPIVIVRKCETIKKLLEIYPSALVIYVQSILSGEDLVTKLVSLGESKEDAIKRQSRNFIDLQDYVDSIQQLPNSIRVVVNDFNEEDNGTVFAQIEDIYQEEIANYSFKENSIFVIQSYSQDNNEKYAKIEKVVDELSNNIGIKISVERADLSKDGSYIIPDHVWNSIDSSDFIICDVTPDRCCHCEQQEDYNGKNVLKKYRQGTSANVWLELGYAIATMKIRNVNLENRLIIATGESQTILPVDIGGDARCVIRYSNSNDLAWQIHCALKKIIMTEIN